MTDEEYQQRYNTELSPEEEAKYKAWVESQSKTQKRDISKDEIDYDLRGDWKAGAERDERGHGGDTFKKPNHPTFSEHSKYHALPDDEGEAHVGGKWVKDKEGNYVGFEQSETNKKHWPEWAIRDYLDKQEPGIKLHKGKK